MALRGGDRPTDTSAASSYLVEFLGKSPLPGVDDCAYRVWCYRVSWTSQPKDLKGRVGLVFSSRLDIKDPASYLDVQMIQDTHIAKTAGDDKQYVFGDIDPSKATSITLCFVAPRTEDSFSPVLLATKIAEAGAWLSLPFRTDPETPASLTQTMVGPAFICPSEVQPSSCVLAHSARHVLKATLGSIEVPTDPGTQSAFQRGNALAKFSFLRQLALQPGEVGAAREHLVSMQPASGDDIALSPTSPLWEHLTAFEGMLVRSNLPPASSLSQVPLITLSTFGNAVAKLREHSVNVARNITSTHDVHHQSTISLTGGGPANTAVQQKEVRVRTLLLRAAKIANMRLALNTFERKVLPIGWLNLERLEMAPAGIVRGELIAAIPLAPLEETAVVQKEWSVRSKEFTSIVTDSLENYSETGVTDNTELAQSTTSQQQHNNQFNITGTVSGGIPIINGSVTATFAAQDAGSETATDSRKHATNVTQKASSRSKQEHKVTISTTTVTGTSASTTRTLKNPSPTDPIRIDYFSMMREWRVRLYRYGLRLTYDLVIPEPGGTLRETYGYLEWLRGQVGPFHFSEAHSSINENNYQQLADKYAAVVPNPPKSEQTFSIQHTPEVGGSAHFSSISIPSIPNGYAIDSITLDGGAHGPEGRKLGYGIFGTTFFKQNGQSDQEPFPATEPIHPLKDTSGRNFLFGAEGLQTIGVFMNDAVGAGLVLAVNVKSTPAAKAQWQSDVWNALYNAAQTQYYAQQQDIAAKIAQLEDRLRNVDTLTLRREESEEIMKIAIATLVGDSVDKIWKDLRNIALAALPPNTPPAPPPNFPPAIYIGASFDASGLKYGDLNAAVPDEELVRFINQAIEWENVVTFLYPYFWDIPESWNFIRQLQHPDATRQAFLRAGSARVVLTVRRGWEEKWANFVDTGDPYSGGSQYLSIAQEIAAYDDRNYPGIPPANPGRSATRLEDAVYTTATRSAVPDQNAGPVTILVASSTGFVVGLPVVIDVYDPNTLIQESGIVTAIPSTTAITIDRLLYSHGADIPFRPFPIVQPGEKGVLIAEWNEYTPTSGTDIAVTSHLATIA